MEFLKHLFGVCGDGHPSILWFIGSVGVVWVYLKTGFHICWKKGCEICKRQFKVLKNKKNI